jgi:hypothetical protein
MKTTILSTILCTAILSSAQASTIGVDPVAGETALASGLGGLTVGWEFRVSAPDGILVDGLGFWDYRSDGFLLDQTFHVGLWNASSGTLLGNSIITSASISQPSIHPTGDWRINSISPVFLASGFYRIGALMPASGANPIIITAAVQSAPGVTFVRYLRQLGNPALTMPDILPATESTLIGPTFTFTPVPEPGPISLLLVGLSLLRILSVSRGRFRGRRR